MSTLFSDLQTMEFLIDPRPEEAKIVCLCGSTRFKDLFIEANFACTTSGYIVLTIGCDMREDWELFNLNSSKFRRTKWELDQLHFRKIELADIVVILNENNYIGLSVCDELLYAIALKKKIAFLMTPSQELLDFIGYSVMLFLI